jgi:hypothetical protein
VNKTSIKYWKSFYKSIKPCYKCGSDNTDVEYDISGEVVAFIMCYSCMTKGPKTTVMANAKVDDYYADEAARDLWNEEWDSKATKLLKHLIGYDDF